ncbi:DUF2252 domain-containing protein [Chitinophaga vietnamensis]|uniref:DUF2252 domain-containing protein n=1 Tax=Chitinophaga vietnamensis TaxID=2593957 RepID=UPI0011789CF7|nr:DUF2252 family protein [Chitinophaga vietnamensis]
MRNIPSRIKKFNEGRLPDMLRIKYAAMRENAFRFYRGTCHLFYEDFPRKSALLKSPNTWLCGDLHLENFGSFKGDNHIPYFDINDFDESILGPCLLDPARLMCSVLVASEVLGINTGQASQLFRLFIDEYAGTLSMGYIRPLERETATGIVRDFLDAVRNRKHKPFMEKRMQYKGKSPRLIIDGVKTLKVPKEEKEKVKEAIHKWAAKRPDAAAFRVEDVAYRIAGTGSLGVERYVALVAGKGGAYGNYLIDLKFSPPACILAYHKFPQPVWSSDAARVTEVQKRMEAASPALLTHIDIGGKDFILRALQPMEDKLDYQLFSGKTKKLEEILICMAQICAWDNLRSSGRQGSAIADELIAFGSDVKRWKDPLFEYSRDYALQVKKDFKEYAKAYDKGEMKI